MTAKKTRNGTPKRKRWHIDWAKFSTETERWYRLRETPAGELSREDLEFLLSIRSSIDSEWRRPENVGARQATLRGACDWALDWWARVHERRPKETPAQHRARLATPRMAARERERAQALTEVLADLEPRSNPVSIREVLRLLRGGKPDTGSDDSRRVTTGYRLAYELAKRAEVWTKSTEDSIRKAKGVE